MIIARQPVCDKPPMSVRVGDLAIQGFTWTAFLPSATDPSATDASLEAPRI